VNKKTLKRYTKKEFNIINAPLVKATAVGSRTGSRMKASRFVMYHDVIDRADRAEYLPTHPKGILDIEAFLIYSYFMSN
jgi:hypothetical protein